VVEGVEFVKTSGINDTFGELFKAELQGWFIVLFPTEKGKTIYITIQDLLHLDVTVSVQIKPFTSTSFYY
jgi:hypothetical protein